MSSFKITRWKKGMVFGVPLDDGTFGMAQAIDNMMPNVVYVAIFTTRLHALPEDIENLDRNNIISLNATWKQDLNSGKWANICILPPVVSKIDFPNEEFGKNGYIGAKHSNAGLLSDFLSAFHGLTPWNVMADEMYWDSYLNAGQGRPEKVTILSAEDRKKYRIEVLGIADA